MTLRIDDPESEKLILELSTLTGETPEQVLITALAERLKRERQNKLKDDTNRSIAEEFASLSTVDGRSINEILGYDENGLPT